MATQILAMQLIQATYMGIKEAKGLWSDADYSGLFCKPILRLKTNRELCPSHMSPSL